MKPTSLIPPAAAVALLAAAVFTAVTVAQAPQERPAGARPARSYPAPTNLQVLPKDLSGQQVHEIMEGWAGSLGVHCDTCHAADPNNVGPNGRPRLKFSDDSKPEKSTARLMYKMTQNINANYISMVSGEDGKPAQPVACGTCHRGHLHPETFTIPQEEHHSEGAPQAR